MQHGFKDLNSQTRHYRLTDDPRRFSSYLLLTDLLYFLFIFYLPWCTIPDFPSISSLISLPFLFCCHRTTTAILRNERETMPSASQHNGGLIKGPL